MLGDVRRPVCRLFSGFEGFHEKNLNHVGPGSSFALGEGFNLAHEGVREPDGNLFGRHIKIIGKIKKSLDKSFVVI